MQQPAERTGRIATARASQSPLAGYATRKGTDQQSKKQQYRTIFEQPRETASNILQNGSPKDLPPNRFTWSVTFAVDPSHSSS
jgi:hypothetical protein